MSIFKQGKLSKPEFISKTIKALLVSLIFGLVTSLTFPGDDNTGKGMMHIIFNLSFFIILFSYLVILFRKSLDENLEFDFAEDDGNTKYFASHNLVAVILLMILGNVFYNNSKHIYNTSLAFHNEFKQVGQEKETYYDNMWKTYSMKDNIVIRNKETFIEVTNILMDGRRDGQSATWKWVQENQPVPYGEFTRFYSDLSNFIESQRSGYLTLETKAQKIAKENNTFLDVVPNNLYNIILRCDHITYKPGFTSTRTQQVFESGIEDLK